MIAFWFRHKNCIFLKYLYIAALIHGSVAVLTIDSDFCGTQCLAKRCKLRCAAKCVTSSHLTIEECTATSECQNYASEDLCNDRLNERNGINATCWYKCKDLSQSRKIPPILTGIKFAYNDLYCVDMDFTGQEDAIYLLAYSMDETMDNQKEIIIESNLFTNWSRGVVDNEYFCKATYIRVATLKVDGISNFSEVHLLPAPPPMIDTHLSVDTLRYNSSSHLFDGHFPNGIIHLVLSYEETSWPLGDEDLLVEPVFHMIGCKEMDLSFALPSPTFRKGAKPRTIETDFSADVMRMNCDFLYYAESAKSGKCGITSSSNTLDGKSIEQLKIACDTVENSPCRSKSEKHCPPTCGQVEAVSHKVLNEFIDADDPNTNITVKITFRSTLKRREPLYFVAFLGYANNFENETNLKSERIGVNMYEILGSVTNCPEFSNNRTCTKKLNSINGSIIFNNLRMDTLYGVTICAVLDVKNLTFPIMTKTTQFLKPKAHRINIRSSDYKKQKWPKFIAIGFGILTGLFVLLVTIFANIHRKQQYKMKLNTFKLEQLRIETEKRYTQLPEKQDLWELERRFLINYEDRKLGTGAFGAVYLGKLIGVAKAHKDAKSALGANLMRVENCEVAVKMLPEYADQASKSEFLQEINLMKTLGYHERLVNMLACITETEPFCLVVEYCSDGDLHQYLLARCNYMLELNAKGINYTENTKDMTATVNVDLIITLKQLLMFAVQISYGLEYLSHMGFVHRDVAARNVLVHDKVNAKIGDFGLCRYIYAKAANYQGRGGRLPVKWMSPEAIKHYDFTTKSDVWSFGVLMFEIITLGGSPYPGIQPEDVLQFLESGRRMDRPDNCPQTYYELMQECWLIDPSMRPNFDVIRRRLAADLEEATEEYSYLKLDCLRDYYNVQPGDTATSVTQDKIDIISETN